jgi:hypothetical protein
MKVGVLAITLAILLVGGPVLAGPATDMDSDGTFDVLDVCKLDPNVPSPSGGCDTDQDGYGNVCDADLNNDGLVNGQDFNTPGLNNDFLECFLGGSDPTNIGCDLNCDTIINGADFNSPTLPDFLEAFLAGTPPGPSGLPCAGTVPCP